MRNVLQILILLSVLAGQGAALSAADGPSRGLKTSAPVLEAKLNQDTLDISVDGKLFTTYHFNRDLIKPYFWPLNAPGSGASVTTESSEPYPHHNSLFFGCDRLNGGDYWHLKKEDGQIFSDGPVVEQASGKQVVFSDTSLWKHPDQEPVIRDTRRVVVRAPNARLRVLDFVVTLEALTDIRINKTNHSLFAARMLPALSAKEGGHLVNAEGDQGEKGTFGKASPWCVGYGTREGLVEGLGIVQHPGNPWYPSPWFTRDYGFFSPTPMYWLKDGHLDLEQGSRTTLRYRVVVFTDPQPEQRMQEVHRAFMAAPLGGRLDDSSATWTACATWQEGQSPEPLARVERLVHRATLDEAQALELQLLALLSRPDGTPDAMRWACRQLSIVGSDVSVASLFKLAGNPDLADACLFALERIGGEKVWRTFRDLLPSAQGPLKLGLIHAIARAPAATDLPLLGAIAREGTLAERRAAIEAMGALADPKVLEVLSKLPSDPRLLTAHYDALLGSARKLLAAQESVPEAWVLAWMGDEHPAQVRLAAARLLVRLNGPAAFKALLNWTAAGPEDLATLAARESVQVADKQGLQQLKQTLPSLPPARQRIVLAALAERGGPDLAALALSLLDAQDARVRLDALLLLGQTGGAEQVPVLVDRLSRSGEEAEAARAALTALKDPLAEARLARAVEQAGADLGPVLIDILADRGAPESVKTYFKAASHAQEAVRKAAYKALADQALPDDLKGLLGLLVQAGQPDDLKAAQRALAQTAVRTGSQERAARLVAEALDKADSDPVVLALVETLGRLPGDTARATLTGLLKDDRVEVRKAAVRWLGRWPDAGPARDLLAAAEAEKDPGVHALALRGFLDLVQKDESLNDQARSALYHRALECAQRPEDRARIEALLADVNITELKAASGKAYRLEKKALQDGAVWAIDRNYTLQGVPENLRGASYLVTAMEDRDLQKDPLLTLTSTGPVEVWVGHDHRATNKPAWLKSWEKTGQALGVSNKSCRLELFKKRYPAGPVALGPNAAPGAGAMYTVILKPLAE